MTLGPLRACVQAVQADARPGADRVPDLDREGAESGIPHRFRWLIRGVIFASVTVVVCGALLGLRACRSKVEDRPPIAPTLGPVR
jgi:hypothetical protein